jgi:hypothetical protein
LRLANSQQVRQNLLGESKRKTKVNEYKRPEQKYIHRGEAGLKDGLVGE